MALANKNARIVWAMLAHDRPYQADYVSAKPARPAAAIDKTTSGRYTTDCSGDHEVMARQVRPGLAKPVVAAAPRVRASN